MSLRLKFALLFSAMLLTALLAFGFGMHVAIERMTRQTAERELSERAHALIAANDTQQNDFHFKPVAPEEQAGTLTSVQIFRPNCSLTRVFNRMRQMMVAGRVLPLSEDGLLAIQDGQAWLEETEWSNETHLVYSLPIVDEERLIGVAQVAQPFGEQERMLITLRDGLLFGGGAVAVLAFGLVWGVAGHTLHPISRMVKDAQIIATRRDFNRQLQPANADGDLNRLAVALNTMLAELQTAYRQAESTLESQRDLMADVSHELRAPLTTVRGNLGLLQRDVPMDPAERRAILRDAVDEVERMSRLVNEMLLLTRSGYTQAMRLSPVDVAPLAANMRRKALALAQRRSIVLDLRADHVIIQGNPDALDQVLLILLDNAVKFTPDGGQITLSLEADASHAYISVHDTGVGIAPEALPRVFDRFYQAQGAQTGHGLGLTIARSLVEAQGGTISVRSTRAHGSVLQCRCPSPRSHSPPLHFGEGWGERNGPWLARGHVLLEGVPGLAKTLTIKSLAQVVGGTFGRVLFTPDLVPADLTGTRIYNGKTGEFITSTQVSWVEERQQVTALAVGLGVLALVFAGLLSLRWF